MKLAMMVGPEQMEHVDFHCMMEQDMPLMWM